MNLSVELIAKDYMYELYYIERYSDVVYELNNSLNKLLIKKLSKKCDNYNFSISKSYRYNPKSFYEDKEPQNITIYLNNSEEGIEIKNLLTLDFNKLNYESLNLDLKCANKKDFPFKINLNSFKEDSEVNFFVPYEFSLFENLHLFKNLHTKKCLNNIYIKSKFKKTFFEKIIFELNITDKIYESKFLLNVYAIISLQKIGINFYTKKYFYPQEKNYLITYKEIKKVVENKIKTDTFIKICEDYLELQKHSIKF